MNVLPRSRTASTMLVAIEDLFWLTLLIPTGIVFQGILQLARAYYAIRRRGSKLAAAYTLTVATILGLLLFRFARRSKAA